MVTENNKMSKPLILINGEVREMTDEEYANYEALVASNQLLPSPD
jgi:hypothetical protein